MLNISNCTRTCISILTSTADLNQVQLASDNVYELPYSYKSWKLELCLKKGDTELCRHGGLEICRNLELESCRQHYFEGWKIADTFFFRGVDIYLRL